MAGLEDLARTMMPYVLYLKLKSNKVTLKGGIDLDGSIVRVNGTFDPDVFVRAIASNRISLDIRSNLKFDDVSMYLIVSLFSSFHSLFSTFNKQILSKSLKMNIWLFTLFSLLTQ